MTISFYAVCLKSFQAGINHGKWILADLELDDIQMEIQGMLRRSSFKKATRWRIHKFDSAFNFNFLNDETNLETLHDMAMFILSHGYRGGKLLEYFQGDVREATDTLARYLGVFDDPISFVKQFFSTYYKPSSIVKECMNFNALWQRLSVTHYFALPAKKGGIHIFAKGNDKRF